MANLTLDGWGEAVADQAVSHISTETWGRLISPAGGARCRLLASLASSMLDGLRLGHRVFANLVDWLLGLLGMEGIERRFARELASRLPLPGEAKAIATARGVQVTGIVLCIMRGDTMRECQCFIDLAVSESKARAKEILVAAMSDWVQLARFPPVTPKNGSW